VTAWWVWVRVRVGTFPFLDPSISRREAMALPLTGMRRLLQTGEARADVWIVFGLAMATAAAAVVLWRRGARGTLAGAALGLGLLMTALGPNALRSPGEAVRVLAPAQVFVALVAVTTVRRETAPA
jgi:LPXTG-motif cell wall-anchored protein